MFATISQAICRRGVVSSSVACKSITIGQTSQRLAFTTGAHARSMVTLPYGTSVRKFSASPEKIELPEFDPDAVVEGTMPMPPSARSIVTHPYSLDDRPLSEQGASNPEDRFAVVALSGTQYKVAVGDTIIADHIEGVDIGDIVVYPEVLLVGSRKATVVGRPYVTHAEVVCSVEELTRDKKVITFKTRRRKASRRIRGFRRRVAVLRVDSIRVSEDDQSLL
jgi:large subunit ribosomal protein L21